MRVITWISVSQMARIPFVTLKDISGYQRKVQNKNNYSETNETLLPSSTRNGHLPSDCRVEKAIDPMYLPSGIRWRRYNWPLF